MSTTPVFDRVFAQTKFTAFPVEYTDRYTPEVARQQGELEGVRKERQRILNLIHSRKQTKALEGLRAEIEVEDE